MRPPPATMPTMARQVLLRTFFFPDGRRTRVTPSSALWDTMVVVSRSASKLALVTRALFNVGNHSTFGHRRERQDVSDLELRLLSAKHKLAGVHTLGTNEVLLGN